MSYCPRTACQLSKPKSIGFKWLIPVAFHLQSTKNLHTGNYAGMTANYAGITCITPAPGTEKMGKTQNKLLNLQLVVSALDFFQKVDQVVLKTLFTFEQ